MNIVFTGPMGSGKTTLGKNVARVLEYGFVDIDKTIEERAGCEVSEIFASHGEEVFRHMEKETVMGVASMDCLVIATGGGVVLDPENMRALRKNGVIFNITTDTDVLYERLSKGWGRPLFKDREALGEYIAGRQKQYLNADYVVDTTDTNVYTSVEYIVKLFEGPRTRLCVSISGNDPLDQIKRAAEEGATLVELRFDLIPDPNVPLLIKSSGVTVIATDRKNKDNLVRAIEAGVGFVDIEHDSPEREMISSLAKENDCKVIVSIHDYEGVPDELPEKKDADLLKIAAKVSNEDDEEKLLDLLADRDDLIVVGMGEKGKMTRMDAPMLGSYLTYCHLGKETAPGQLTLEEMVAEYKRRGLR